MSIPSPFKFLDAYDKADKDIFFGREKETEMLYEKAFRSKFILVYGASGIGKTSLINCGLANRFSDTDWFELFFRRQGNINQSLSNGLLDALHESMKFSRKKAKRKLPSPDASVQELIQSLYIRYFKPIYLIFDQFEELFILGTPEEKAEIIETFQALGDSEAHCTIIIIMREEYLADLDDFEAEIPLFLANRMRVEAMSRLQTESVVRQTVMSPKIGVEVENPDLTIPSIVDKISDGRSVQLAYLQVYLDRLYRSSIQNGQAVFSPELVNKTGELGDVMGLFLEEQIENIHQQLSLEYSDLSVDRIRELLSKFVTLDGTKLPVNEEDLYEQLRPLEPDFIDAAAQQLVTGRILRFSNGVYEVAHDSLAKRIAENISLEERKLREVKLLVENRYDSFLITGALLSPKELGYIALYEDRIELSQDEKTFLQKSRRQAQKRRQRLIGAVMLFVLIVSLAGVAIWNAIDANRQRVLVSNQADSLRTFSEFLKTSKDSLQVSKNNLEISKDSLLTSKNRIDSFFEVVSLQKVKQEKLAAAYQQVSNALLALPDDPTIAFDYAVKGWNIDQNFSTQKALYDIYGEYPQYKVLATKSTDMVPVGISPDGHFIAFNPVRKRTSVILEDVQGNKLGDFNATDYVRAIKFSPDSRYLVTGTDDGGYFWSLESYENPPLRLDMKKGEDALGISFSASSDSFAIESKEGEVYLWKSGNPTHLSKFQEYKDLAKISSFKKQQDPILNMVKLIGHQQEVNGFVLSPDRASTYTFSRDGTVRKWTLPAVVVNDILFKEGRISYAGILANNQIVAGSNYGVLRFWDSNGKMVDEPSLPYEMTEIKAVSRDRTVIVAIDEENPRDIVLRPKSGKLITLKGHEGNITKVMISPDNEYVVSGSVDKMIRVWKLSTQQSTVLNGHTGTISALDISSDGSVIVSGSLDGTAIVWDFQGRKKARLTGHKDQITCVAVSPDKYHIITGSKDNMLNIWSVTGKLVKKIEGHKSMITASDFSPDGKWIISGDESGEIRLWDKFGGLFMVMDAGSEILNLDFSPDSNQFLATTQDGKIYVWEPVKKSLERYLSIYEKINK